MSTHDYGDTMVEALRRANPVPAGATEHRRTTPSAHALFADIIAEPPRRSTNRVRTRAIVIVVAIILIVLGLVAFVTVRKDKPTLPTSAVCYSAADLNAKRVVVSGAAKPETACAAIWSAGGFEKLGVKTHPPAGYDVCVLPAGVAAVFPGESGSVCAALHLPESKGGDRNIAGFAAEADARLNAVCMKFAPAARIVRSELEKWQLDGWTVVRGDYPYTADRPCSAIAVLAEEHQVNIVSYPGPHPAPK